MAPILTELCPSQRVAFDSAMAALETTTAAVVHCAEGLGRTTVLRALHASLGGAFLGGRELLEASRDSHPLATEETFHALISRALAAADVVIVDDLHLLANATTFHQFHPRGALLLDAVVALTSMAEEAGKTLVFGADGRTATTLLARIDRTVIADLTVDDFRYLCIAWLGAERAASLDVTKIHRFAPKLNARQLRRTCESLAHQDADVTTEAFLEHVAVHHLASNVRMGEVQDVDLSDLRGMEDVLEALEASVVFPLENAELAAEFRLRPKRGVLLAGPPGTGKTTIGRALARRLRGKFFLLDGTVISGSRDFYERVKRLFELAKRNAPAIIFIDDSDVIFEANNETGLYRFLLTMLDGIESETAGRICVMLTAMDVGNLPPALVRSGRIELWLETRLPDLTARALILADRCAELPQSVGAVDIDRIAASTEGMSGADLKRMVDDGKLLYAYDIARARSLTSITDYILAALETVRANKHQYAAAEARARSQRPVRPPQFMVGHAMAD